MDSFLKAFNISFLLRNVFSGIFFVIAYYMASHNPLEFSKIDEIDFLSMALPVALFAGVTSYGILRSFLYPFIEYFFDSDCGKAWRQCKPLISDSTIGTLLWRWGQVDKAMTFDRERIKEINERLNMWSDLIYLQYNSALCIALGAWVGAVIDPGKHCPYVPLIVLAVLLLVFAFISNWRHHSVLDRLRKAMHPSRNLSISINRNAKDVYDFVCVPENFSLWASGIGKSLKKVNGEWIAETPQGPMKVRFTARNEFGILDHWVSPKPGVQIYIPMRVIANGNGSELIFTLFRLPDMSDEQFSADAEWVMRDLTSLKNLLEAS